MIIDKCMYISQKFTSKPGLRNHQNSVHSEDNTAVQCQTCGIVRVGFIIYYYCFIEYVQYVVISAAIDFNSDLKE